MRYGSGVGCRPMVAPRLFKHGWIGVNEAEGIGVVARIFPGCVVVPNLYYRGTGLQACSYERCASNTKSCVHVDAWGRGWHPRCFELAANE